MPLVVHVVGAAPTFVKVAPLVRALASSGVAQELWQTGPGDDPLLSPTLLSDLKLPTPTVNIDLEPGAGAEEGAPALRAFDRALARLPRPDFVVLPGDGSPFLAAARAARAREIPVAHLEAGLRSHDPTDPAERARVLVDQNSSLLFTATVDGDENLLGEGFARSAVALVGSTLVDSLLAALPVSRERAVPDQLGLEGGNYALLTLRQDATLDDPEALGRVLAAVAKIADRLPVVFLVDPRSVGRLGAQALAPSLAALKLMRPLGFLDFVSLLAAARLVLTDSGELQDEATALGIPCLTLRESTERAVTLREGTNVLVGTDPARILAAARRALDRLPRGEGPDLWDGSAGRRAAAALLDRAGSAASKAG
ncbi:MAG TPA: UDP-N-acetylglucosamine 2-epimerase [Anaeromyxobacteraceae bacterium]|nr:UDP-N-acetylglucosamine 2-epimerase [Anaeromyxobacteraceae bacterium]